MLKSKWLRYLEKIGGGILLNNPKVVKWLTKKEKQYLNSKEKIKKIQSELFTIHELQSNETNQMKGAYTIIESIVDLITEVIFEVDLNGNILFINNAWEEISGSTVEKSIGKSFLSFVNPEDLPGLRIAIGWLLNGNRSKIELRFRIKHSNQNLIWVDFLAKVNIDYNDLIVGYHGTLLNIQFQREMEGKMSNANEYLEKRIEEEIQLNRKKDYVLQQHFAETQMGELLDTIAHQWRQPMNTISLAASDIILDLQLGESGESIIEKLKLIIQKTKIMSNTIDHFSSYYQKERLITQFKMKDLVSILLDIYQVSMYKNKIQFEYIENDEITINSFKKDYQQVLVNILNNSIFAHEMSDEKEKYIKIIAKIEENMLRIEVIDNAGGIPNEFFNKVFDIYFTGYKNLNKSGLGLFFCKQIIETNLKGSLYLENFENGLKVNILIPQSNDELMNKEI
jgi:PAS domain S-box-containing protein